MIILTSLFAVSLSHASTPCGCSRDIQITIEPTLDCLEWNPLNDFCDYEVSDEPRATIMNNCNEPVLIVCPEEGVECTHTYTNNSGNSCSFGIFLEAENEYGISSTEFQVLLSEGESVSWGESFYGEGIYNSNASGPTYQCNITLGEDIYSTSIEAEYFCDYTDPYETSSKTGCQSMVQTEKHPFILIFAVLVMGLRYSSRASRA